MATKLSATELDKLNRVTADSAIVAQLLPIRSVGVQVGRDGVVVALIFVQGDARTYSYVAALNTIGERVNWSHMQYLASVIPKLLHSINRYV